MNRNCFTKFMAHSKFITDIGFYHYCCLIISKPSSLLLLPVGIAVQAATNHSVDREIWTVLFGSCLSRKGCILVMDALGDAGFCFVFHCCLVFCY